MFNLKQKLCLLISTLGLGSPRKQYELLTLFGSPEELWNNIASREKEIRQVIGDQNYTRLRYSLREDYCDKLYDDLQAKDIIPVTFYCSAYPTLLKEIYDPPLVLYCKGEISLLNEVCLSVVGTRKASAYGRKVTQFFVEQLARKYVIVSGLALGADTAAHETTLAQGGKTIAVLGSGLLNVYPSSNRALAENIILSGGLVISELQPYAEPNHYNFPMRNRIISGLSEGLLITEAPIKSGVMSTYEYACEQNRDVYVVPGDIFDFNYKGSNQLIKNVQRTMVTTPFDIIEVDTRLAKRKKVQIQLDIEEQIVVDLLSQEGRMHFDDIARKTKLKASQINYALASLELKGMILKLPNNVYSVVYAEE